MKTLIYISKCFASYATFILFFLVLKSPLLAQCINASLSTGSAETGEQVCISATVVDVNACRTLTGTSVRISGNQIELILRYSDPGGTCVQPYFETDIQECFSVSAPGNYSASGIVLVNGSEDGGCSIGNLTITGNADGCEIRSARVGNNITCDDNDTPQNPNDDRIVFSLAPTGSGVSSRYTVTSDNVSITPSEGTYGSRTTFTTGPGAAASGDFSIVITDNTDNSCFLEVDIDDPGICSQAPPCNEPTTNELSVTNITATSARLSCSRNGVQRYDWRYRTAGTFRWNELSATTNNAKDLSGLEPATTYEYEVRLNCYASRWSSWSNRLTFTTTSDNNNTPDEGNDCRTRDSLALVELYNATNGPNWTNTWNLNQPMDTWYGVFLNAEGCVTCLDLDGSPNCSSSPSSGNNLVGKLIDLNLPQLEGLCIARNQLSGSIPDFSNLPNLETFICRFNQLSGSIPDLSDNCPALEDFEVQENRFTFEHLLPSLVANETIIAQNAVDTFDGYSYAPQDAIYTDTLISASVSAPLTIDLGIDEGITDNVYQWYKDGQPYTTITGDNQLVFSSLQLSDAGVYTVEVTNPGAPELTLESFPITLQVEGNSCRQQDSLALVELYNATNGPNWTNTWNLNQPMDTWYGVFLNAEGCVTCLDLDGSPFCSLSRSDGNNLVGELIDLNLPQLEGLYIASNNLSGSIPDFTELPNLRVFDCEFNNLSGPIPDFTNLPNLEFFDCAVNELSGSIPDFTNLSNLVSFDCAGNELSGPIPNFTNLPKLESFNCRGIGNELSGPIPDFTELPNLRNFYCSNNNLSGPIPDFTNLPNLEDFRCYNNELSGSIPDFTNLPNLEDFWCYNNELSGSIPDFTNLPNLEIFYCRGNQLSGSIPDFTNLPNLESFSCGFNQLSGSIPDFTNLPNLETFRCDNNQLSGSIPDFTNLPNLERFLCYNNQLSGSIPGFSDNCPNLKLLWYDENRFTFEGILPHIDANQQLITANAQASFDSLRYAPQESIYTDTLISASVGAPLTVDLGIDEGIADNVYQWYKDGQPYTTITGNNQLVFSSLQLSDAGVYTVAVTNPGAPELTLESFPITLELNESNTLNLALDDAVGVVGQRVCLPVRASNFNDINLLDLVYEFDADFLTFDGIANVNLPGLTPTNFLTVGIGRLRMVWDSAQGISASSDEVLFELCFNINEATENTNIAVTSGLATRFADGMITNLDVSSSGGNVSVLPPIRLIAGEAEGNPGDVVRLPIMIENGDQLAALQGRITFELPEIAEVLGIEPLYLETILNTANNNFVFYDRTGAGLNLEPLDTLFFLELRLVGERGSTSSVNFGDGDTFPLEAHIFDNNSLNILQIATETVAGTVTIWEAVNVSGRIARYTGSPIEGVNVMANIETANGQSEERQTMTDAEGNYRFEEISIGSQITLMPSFSESNLEGRNLSRDLDAMQAHLDGENSPRISSSMQMIAGDVNCDGVVTTADLTLIQGVMIGLSSNFPGCAPWHFIPENSKGDFNMDARYYSGAYPFSEMSNVNSITEDTEVNFIGIQTGDLIVEDDPQ